MQRLEMTKVTQIAVVDLPEYHLCLFIGNKSLWALRLEALFTDQGSGHHFTPRKISGVREVKSFATFHGNGNFLVFYKQPSPLPLQSPSLKVLKAIPVHQAIWTPKSSSAFNRLLGGSADISGLFHDVGSVDLPRVSGPLTIVRHPAFFGPKIAVCDSIGNSIIHILYLPKSAETRQSLSAISHSTLHPLPSMDGEIMGQALLGIFSLTDDVSLICYPKCAVVSGEYQRTYGFTIHFLGAAKSAAMFDKYLALFHQYFVEIRDVITGELRQIIHRQDIRCLDDGNRGANTQGPQRTLKFRMAHPDESGYLVLEMLLDESFVDAENVERGRGSALQAAVLGGEASRIS